MAGHDPQQTQEMLQSLVTDVSKAVETLRELARGIYPAVLADLGLAAALEAQAARSPLTVEIHADSIHRHPLEVEAAVYFCCLEALQNAVKHARATTVVITVEESGGELRFAVTDNGHGMDVTRARSGSGIQNMMDRLAALHGSLELDTARGGGTSVSGRLPVAVQGDAEDDQGDAGEVPDGGDLAEDDQADDGGGGRQQREHEGEGGAGQAGHRQLVGDVGDDR